MFIEFGYVRVPYFVARGACYLERGIAGGGVDSECRSPLKTCFGRQTMLGISGLSVYQHSWEIQVRRLPLASCGMRGVSPSPKQE